MRQLMMRAVIALGVPFAIATLLIIRSIQRRSPWHPVKTVGRTVGETRARYDDFFGALEYQQRRAERSVLSNLLEDSVPALFGLSRASSSTTSSSSASSSTTSSGNRR